MKARRIAKIIEDFAPLNLAEKWDNVGFQIGSRNKEVKKVLVTLDITDETIKEAIDEDVDMVISHHPFFFNGIKRIDLDSYKGKLIKDILDNDIVIYSAHTNLDKARYGINELIAIRLDLKDIKVLKPDSINHKFVKFAVYVPTDSVETVKEALYKNNVGNITEKYKNTTFSTDGVGTFEPIGDANPTIGELDKLEKVDEVKIETIVSKQDVASVLEDVKRVHPYEEMAYDIYETEVLDKKILEGLGRIGKTKEVYKPNQFIHFVKEKLELTNLREAGKRPKEVKKVAICSGAGADMITLSRNKGADVLITGDIKHHDAQLAYELGFWVLDAGHFGTEKLVTQLFEGLLNWKTNDGEIEVIPSKATKDFIKQIKLSMILESE